MTAANPFKMDCLIYDGYISKEGYGFKTSRQGSSLAHRQAYERECGPIGEGRDIHHLCGVKSCVEPDHLISVTQEEHANLFGRKMRKKNLCLRGHQRTPETVDGSGRCLACRREDYALARATI